MPDIHALLSASSSKQWLHCPPSARLQLGFPNVSSVYTEEGTFAHEVCEYKVRQYLQEHMNKPHSDQYDTEEIDAVTDVYAEFVITTVEHMKQNGCTPLVLVEEKVDYSHIAPEGFGTADVMIIGKAADGKGLLHVCDFKTGKGVRIEADHNSQMMLYAIGGLKAYSYIYPIETIRMTIIQPRLDNISTYECSREELEAWGESIKPIAKLAFEGKGEQKTGDWCRFCRAKPVCQACLNEALSICKEEFMEEKYASPSEALSVINMADEHKQQTNTISKEIGLPVFRQPGLIPLTQLSSVLPLLERIGAWVEAVFAYVSEEAINHGVEISGYKVVEGRSKRVFTDAAAAAETAIRNGYTEIYKQQMLSLTELEKMMGKKTFQELLGHYVMKPRGKLTLVPEDDPRDPIVQNTSTGSDFIPLNIEE